MKSIFVVAETITYEKHFLFEYPLTEEFYNYLHKKYFKETKSNKNFQNKNTSSENSFSYLELYLKSFTLENHINQDFIFDIIIDNDRFISFPIWFSKNEYNKRIKREDLKNNNSKNELNKNDDRYMLLNMFNIIFVFSNDEPMNIKQELFKSVYSNLESLSKLLLYEEYNKHYLGIETLRITRMIHKFFTQKKEMINYKNFFEKFSTNNNIYKYIKNIYLGIENNEISHVTIYNIELNYYISMYTNQLKSFQIKPYHSVIITNRRKLNSFFQNATDINPKMIIIIDKIFKMKTLQEISLENNIELNFVMFFANQLVSWNLGNIIFKFNNYSTFQISDNIPEGINLRKHEGIIGFNQAISILNKFTISESTTTLNEIYQIYFKSIDNEVFKRCINYLVERQYLIQTSIIIFSKLKMKNMNDYKKVMINKFCNLTSHKDIYEDVRISKDKNINGNENEEREEENYYYEDFLKEVKEKSNQDFFVLSVIKELIAKKLYIEEISYYTGFKIKEILHVIKKYDPIFDLVVVPLYKIKK